MSCPPHFLLYTTGIIVQDHAIKFILLLVIKILFPPRRFRKCSTRGRGHFLSIVHILTSNLEKDPEKSSGFHRSGYVTLDCSIFMHLSHCHCFRSAFVAMRIRIGSWSRIRLHPQSKQKFISIFSSFNLFYTTDTYLTQIGKLDKFLKILTYRAFVLNIFQNSCEKILVFILPFIASGYRTKLPVRIRVWIKRPK